MTKFDQNLIISKKGYAPISKVCQTTRIPNETSSCIYRNEREITLYDKVINKV